MSDTNIFFLFLVFSDAVTLMTTSGSMSQPFPIEIMFLFNDHDSPLPPLPFQCHIFLQFWVFVFFFIFYCLIMGHSQSHESLGNGRVNPGQCFITWPHLLANKLEFLERNSWTPLRIRKSPSKKTFGSNLRIK